MAFSLSKKHLNLGAVFRGCASCTGSAAGAAFSTHVVCLSAPFLAASFGASVAPSFMNMMYVVSPTLAVVATNLFDYRRCHTFSSLTKNLSVAALAVGITFGLNQIPQSHAAPLSQHAFFETLPRALQDDYERRAVARLKRLPPDLQHEITAHIAREKISLGAYFLVCSGTDPLGQKIRQIESQDAESLNLTSRQP